MRMFTSLQRKERRWTEDLCLQYAASFHCLVEEWKDSEELEPKPKKKLTIVNKKGRDKEASN